MRRKKKPKTVTTPDSCPPRPPCSRFCNLVPYAVLAVFSCLAIAPIAGGEPAARQNTHEKPYALIFGTVWGPDNLPVYGVPVMIRRSRDKKARWELFSNHAGEFAQRVPAGREDYVIWADLRGFKPQNGKQLHAGDQVTIHVDNEERVDTSLHLK